MLKRFIQFLLLIASGAALAYAPQTMYTCGGGTGWFSDAGSACSAYVAYANSVNTTVEYSGARVSGSSCQADGKFKSGPNVGKPSGTLNVGISSASRCSDGSAPTNGQCSVAPTDPPKTCNTPAGQPVSWAGYVGHSASSSANMPDGGGTGLPGQSDTCGIAGGMPDSVGKCYATPAAGGGQDFWCNYTGTSNGQGATPSSGTPKPPGDGTPSKPTGMPPSKAGPSGGCPAGTTQGGVSPDGMAVCVGSGTNPTGANGGAAGDANPTTSTTTKSVDANGNPVETTRETRPNGDGSTTTKTTEKTTNPDGSTSTTTKTVTGLDPNGKQGQPDKPDTDFCRLHPELNMCRNSSIAGQCGQISCMGDAIQCATLRAAAAMQCAQEKDVEAVKAMPAKALGDSILNGSDPMKGDIDAAIKGTEVDLSKANLDQGGFLGGGACLPDKSFSVLGKTVSVSFSRVCQDIQPLRAGIMACAFIVAYLIVARSVLQS